MTPRKKKSDVVVGEVVDDSREAPSSRSLAVSDFVGPVMNDAQMRIVTGKTPAYAIKKRVGPSGRTLSYVPHGYVVDQLNRAFGFDWDLRLTPVNGDSMYALQVEEVPITRAGKPTGDVKTSRHVAVSGELVIRIHDPKTLKTIATITKSGFGSAIWLPGMEFGDALKSARSDLVKTCAYQLGIALDLYWNDEAEQRQYEQRIAEEKHLREEAERVAAAMSAAPRNPVILIARAYGECNMTQSDIQKIAGGISDEELFAMTEEKVSELWEKVLSVGKVNNED